MNMEETIKQMNIDYCLRLAKVLDKEKKAKEKHQKKLDKRVKILFKVMTKTEGKKAQLSVMLELYPQLEHLIQLKMDVLEYKFQKVYDKFIDDIGPVEVVMDNGASIKIGVIPEGDEDGQVNQ